MHYHRDLLATCDTYCARVLQPRPGDLFCGSPPLAFTFGLGGLLLFPLYAGAATLLLEKAGPIELLRAIDAHGVTTLFTAPIAYRAMAGALARLRHLVAAHVRFRGRNAAEGRLGRMAREDRLEHSRWHRKHGDAAHLRRLAASRSSRRARPAASCRATSPKFTTTTAGAVADGTVGRLAVKGPTGCKYLQDERQRVYVQGGWNYPGDAYRRDADGYFWYVARIDDMIVSAGYNISGPEVEQALIAHPDVKEVAVVAKRDAA